MATDTKSKDADVEVTEDVEVETPVETKETEAPVESTKDETGDIESSTDDAPFKPRFTQFKGDDPVEYAQNLEQAYDNSSKEAVRLNQELQGLKASVDGILSKVATNPDYAEQLANDIAPQPQSGITDPTQAWAASRMQEELTREYKEFAEEHPELESDPALAEKVREELATFAEVTWQKSHRLLGMKEGLNKAWVSLGLATGTSAVGLAAKEAAGQAKTTSVKKDVPKTSITDAQLSVGRKMFPNKSVEEVAQLLAQYSK
jgi:hypothetical protein